MGREGWRWEEKGGDGKGEVKIEGGWGRGGDWEGVKEGRGEKRAQGGNGKVMGWGRVKKTSREGLRWEGDGIGKG